MLGEMKAGLILVSLLDMINPPRTIPGVVETLRGAGIRVFMVCLLTFRKAQ